MAKNNFFKNQSALTASKTKIYEEYITGYLPKLLLSFGKCLIADLFCGQGKNGDKNGSPLILLDRIKYILSSPIFRNKNNLKIYILFNDQDENNIKNLISELEKTEYDKSLINITIKNERYEDLLPSLVKKPERNKIPKFFFLDPFTYSNVKMHDLKQLMSLSFTEILLFMPVFHSYRFSSVNFNKDHKTRKFIEEFTKDGIDDYENIHSFMTSIKLKLIQEINLPSNKNTVPYVRYILIDGGGSKNSLFLITGHQKGMLFMNKIAFKTTSDGNCLKVNESLQNSLFATNESTLFHSLFRKKLIEFIKNKKKVSNIALLDFAIRECFLPKDVKQIVKELINLKKVSIFTLNNNRILDSRKWAISDQPKDETVIKWNTDEEN
ncbi:three-Cys-motif partner protein TcmP [Sunxiuqinia sp. sy24]|uniref:three-Cys-motif partner protein TcmP n=1 Tax=Sunxiuqinia sp. sy24 TaxID=3461495 RepID=UPI0040455406